MPRVAGGRHSGDRHPSQEPVHDAVRRAPGNAGLTIDGIDGIVVASNDRYDGRAIPVVTASGPAGGVGRDIVSTPSATEHALLMGAPRVVCGRHRTRFVVAWSPTEAGSLPGMQRLAADPSSRRCLPFDEMGAHALQANAPPAPYRGCKDSRGARRRRTAATARPSIQKRPPAYPRRP